MGTIRRDVTRAWAGLRKLLGTVERLWKRQQHPHEVRRGVGVKPVVQGFIPYLYAPSMQDRMEHAEKALERWFQTFVADQYAMFRRRREYRRPAFFVRVGTELHYIHRGHRHRKQVVNRAKRRAAN